MRSPRPKASFQFDAEELRHLLAALRAWDADKLGARRWSFRCNLIGLVKAALERLS